MKVVVDTNVFISGIFFSGPPYEILDAWRRRKIELVLSPPILDEYRATGDQLAATFPTVDLSPWLHLITVRATMINAPPLGERVCTDADDDKFLACALAGRTRLVISGDKALLKTSGYKGISVRTPRQFVDAQLK